MRSLSLLQKGDHLLSTDVIYGGTYGLFSSLLPKFGIEVSFVDTTEPENVKAGLRESTRLIFLETPANPTMAVSDIAQIGKIAHEAGARLAVDNTFATPYFQRPLALGADAVVESCTKYIGGHGDLLGGVAVGPEEMISGMKRTALLTGGTMGTHEAWLCLRGLKTLHLRMERHAENALALAQFLEKHPAVQKVNYPASAISDGNGPYQRIDPAACVRCGRCEQVCPFGAVEVTTGKVHRVSAGNLAEVFTDGVVLDFVGGEPEPGEGGHRRPPWACRFHS